MDRFDRHLRRATLCVDRDAPRHRLAFTVEEALRLASLPGENEGRVYYFRFLRITGLPASGDRRIWLDAFQRALSANARHAVHGHDPRAASASAVFFRGQQEALEILLHRVVEGSRIQEWFWPMIMPEAAGAISRAQLLPRIVDKMRSGPASWLPVAITLFSKPGLDLVATTEAIPVAAIEEWLREIAGPETGGLRPSASISREAVPALQLALRVFGARNARTLWLATLAILADSPAELARGTAVTRARTLVQSLAATVHSQTPPAPRPGRAEATLETNLPPAVDSATIQPQADRTAAQPPRDSEMPLSSDVAPPLSVQPSVDSQEMSHRPVLSPPAHESQPWTPAIPPSEEVPTPVRIPENANPQATSAPREHIRWFCAGLDTQAAGFFFLLNVLERIGISRLLASRFMAVHPDFVPRLLRKLALCAGLPDDDPIMIWLKTLPAEITDPEEPFACDDSCWPWELQSRRQVASIDYIVRVWYLGVRRWCWRRARIDLRKIVLRLGVFSVNRTDLDVSLPLDEADVRVRKAGLDLDPGWLPWFGRVVRFHYLRRGELRG